MSVSLLSKLFTYFWSVCHRLNAWNWGTDNVAQCRKLYANHITFWNFLMLIYCIKEKFWAVSWCIWVLYFMHQSITHSVDAWLSQWYDSGCRTAAIDSNHTVNSAGGHPAQCIADRRQCTGPAGAGRATTHSAQRPTEHTLTIRTYAASVHEFTAVKCLPF